MITALSRFARSARSAGVGARLSRSLGKVGSNLSGIFKTSGGALVGGGTAGYGFATLEQSLGAQSKDRKLLVYGGAALLAIYSVGQLFDIQVGDG